MKTLEELGLSQCPWSADDWVGAEHGEYDPRIRDAHGKEIAIPLVSNIDATMMAAAPELYEALAACVSWYEHDKPLPYQENGLPMIIHYAKIALAKAEDAE